MKPKAIEAAPSRKRALSVALLALAGGAVVWVEPSLARNAGELGTYLSQQGKGMGMGLSSWSYVGGMAAGVFAMAKLKANRDSPQQHPLSHAAVLGIVCAGLLFLPQSYRFFGDTFQGKNATQNIITGTTDIGAADGGGE